MDLKLKEESEDPDDRALWARAPKFDQCKGDTYDNSGKLQPHTCNGEA